MCRAKVDRLELAVRRLLKHDRRSTPETAGYPEREGWRGDTVAPAAVAWETVLYHRYQASLSSGVSCSCGCLARSASAIRSRDFAQATG
jgi:hypothetical protein